MSSCVPAFSPQSRQRCSVVCLPTLTRPVVRSTTSSVRFRFFYERADLPCAVQHTTKGQRLKWFVDDLERLNLNYYLPIFADGLCETVYPYSFIALHGMLDLIEHASHKIDLETLGQLIAPIKRALCTRHPTVISRVLIILQRLARGNDSALGIALVPFFNQFLPMINIIRESPQRSISSELIRSIDQTLFVLEQCGGPDAFINIKYSVPTYEQQADVKGLTPSQLNTLI